MSITLTEAQSVIEGADFKAGVTKIEVALVKGTTPDSDKAFTLPTMDTKQKTVIVEMPQATVAKQAGTAARLGKGSTLAVTRRIATVNRGMEYVTTVSKVDTADEFKMQAQRWAKDAQVSSVNSLSCVALDFLAGKGNVVTSAKTEPIDILDEAISKAISYVNPALGVRRIQKRRLILRVNDTYYQAIKEKLVKNTNTKANQDTGEVEQYNGVKVKMGDFLPAGVDFILGVDEIVKEPLNFSAYSVIEAEFGDYLTHKYYVYYGINGFYELSWVKTSGTNKIQLSPGSITGSVIVGSEYAEEDALGELGAEGFFTSSDKYVKKAGSSISLPAVGSDFVVGTWIKKEPVEIPHALTYSEVDYTIELGGVTASDWVAIVEVNAEGKVIRASKVQALAGDIKA